MNQAGRDHAQLLAQKEHSGIEYRNRLVRTQNMSCICHCSAEIDLSTLLYFSVNDLNLGKGSYVLILFSETSENSQAQQDGRDVFGRMYTYAIIEEIATEVFTGHHSFYSSELDGRLVFLINFPFGILPDPSIVDYLDHSCLEVSRRCRETYDMEVVGYISHPIDNINFISAVYSKLLENATLHRYLELHAPYPVFHPPVAVPSLWADLSSTMALRAMNLVSAVTNGSDYRAMADAMLHEIVDSHPVNIDMLKQLIVLFVECMYHAAQNLGLKVKPKSQRELEFRAIFDSLHLRETSQCLYRVLDDMKKAHNEQSRRSTQLQLDTALQYIAQNLSDAGLTLERCAAAVGCSTSALNKLFRRQLNTSVARYIRETRLEKAFELLQGGLSVGQTSARCGFGSTETFHRLFKDRFGITPGQIKTAE